MTMRTHYMGDSYRDHTNGFKRTRYQNHHMVDVDREPMGDDIPVFDRYETGHRYAYERPDRLEDRAEVYNPNRRVRYRFR